jgi:hypothetical protein
MLHVNSYMLQGEKGHLQKCCQNDLYIHKNKPLPL